MNEPRRPVVDPRRRLQLGCWPCWRLLAVVPLRAVQLEVTQGAAFRQAASSRCGTDQPARLAGPHPRPRRHGARLRSEVLALAVHYRWLQEPPDAALAAADGPARLPKTQRNDARALAAENLRLANSGSNWAAALAELCGLSPEQWNCACRPKSAAKSSVLVAVHRRRSSEAEPHDAAAGSCRHDRSSAAWDRSVESLAAGLAGRGSTARCRPAGRGTRSITSWPKT